MSETTTIDKAGRLVVPKAMREKLGLRAGSKVRLEVIEDRLEMVADVPEVRIEYREDGRPFIVGGEGVNAAEAVLRRIGHSKYADDQ